LKSFVFSAIPAAAAAGFANAWEAALGAVFISGVLFLLLSLAGARVMDAMSPSMKNAIAAGIGLFIAFIGLQNAGLILKDPGMAVKLNPHFASPDLRLMVSIPLAYSIGDGLALGFISYPLVKFCSGRAREVTWVSYLLAVLLVLYFVFVKGRLAG
jgi:AGZA family xanthine/uracil permease-like MFS transporter